MEFNHVTRSSSLVVLAPSASFLEAGGREWGRGGGVRRS